MKINLVPVKKVLSPLALLSLMVSPIALVKAQVSDYASPKLSITFDDSFSSIYENALPILNEKGLKATAFIATNYVGQTGYMTWPQIQSLQNDYGWEIGSHSLSHAELPILSLAGIQEEVQNSKSLLESQGLNVTSFATPYGAYDNRALSEILKTYNTHRGFWDQDELNIYPYDRSIIWVKSIEKGVTVQDVSSWINQAVSEKKWLTLVLHEILPTTDPDYEYITTTTELTQIADLIKNSGIKVVTPNHTLQKPGPNLLENSSFSEGLSKGWTTDSPAEVLLNNDNNGSYPSSSQSVQFVSAGKSSHFFSNPVIADPKTTYSLEVFVNANALTAGEIGFYVDEYDANNTWISGQWLGKVDPDTVKYYTSYYQPSSLAVNNFRIQTYLTANAGGSAYIDNYELYNLVTEPVPSQNLVLNSSFEEVNSGWAVNWQKDSDFYSIDSASKGNDGLNSVQLVPNLTKAHLFSSPISVDFGSGYTWRQHLASTNTKGEFGFYIDEYDQGGNWISGQWKGMLNAPFTGDKEYIYHPSSSQVRTARLQYYTVADSDFNLNLDSVYFSK